MRNAFFEFTHPVYALIKAPNEVTAIQVYRSDILGEDDAPDPIVWEALGYSKTFRKFREATKGQFVSRDIYEILKTEPPEVLLQDVSYM